MSSVEWDEPTDIGESAERFASRPIYAGRDEEAKPLLDALVHVTAAGKCLRSGVTSDKKQSAQARARGHLRRALEALDPGD